MKKSVFLPILLLLMSATVTGAQEEKRTPYSAMAPIEQYRIADPQEEIALARSAAPPSLAADAEVLVLGKQGYETAVAVWNPRLRAPNCFNPPAVRGVPPLHRCRDRISFVHAVEAGLSQR